MAVNKVIYGNETLIDITDTTATAADVLTGKTLYTANGLRTQGSLGTATTSSDGLMSAADKNKLDNIDMTTKADKSNAQITNSLTLGQRSENSSIGLNSVSIGANNSATTNSTLVVGENSTASGPASIAVGYYAEATNYGSSAFGVSSAASGYSANAAGNDVKAYGDYTQATGRGTIAHGRATHVFGEYNLDGNSTASGNTRGTYLEMVGNGLNNANRSNARTLDWEGNEVIAGKLTVGMAPTADMDVATKQYVDSAATPALVTTSTNGLMSASDKAKLDQLTISIPCVYLDAPSRIEMLYTASSLDLAQSISITPSNTTDQLTYVSMTPNIISITGSGIVTRATPEAYGWGRIKVQCGNQIKYVNINVETDIFLDNENLMDNVANVSASWNSSMDEDNIVAIYFSSSEDRSAWGTYLAPLAANTSVTINWSGTSLIRLSAFYKTASMEITDGKANLNPLVYRNIEPDTDVVKTSWDWNRSNSYSFTTKKEPAYFYFWIDQNGSATRKSAAEHRAYLLDDHYHIIVKSLAEPSTIYADTIIMDDTFAFDFNSRTLQLPMPFINPSNAIDQVQFSSLSPDLFTSTSGGLLTKTSYTNYGWGQVKVTCGNLVKIINVNVKQNLMADPNKWLKPVNWLVSPSNPNSEAESYLGWSSSTTSRSKYGFCLFPNTLAQNTKITFNVTQRDSSGNSTGTSINQARIGYLNDNTTTTYEDNVSYDSDDFKQYTNLYCDPDFTIMRYNSVAYTTTYITSYRDKAVLFILFDPDSSIWTIDNFNPNPEFEAAVERDVQVYVETLNAAPSTISNLGDSRVIDYTLATDANDGLLAAEDKQKLDKITSNTITIGNTTLTEAQLVQLLALLN